MADFKKRIELFIQIKCVDNEQEVGIFRKKENIFQDWRITETVNEEVLTNKIANMLLELKKNLPEEFIGMMNLNEKENEFWINSKEALIADLRKQIYSLKNKIHTMYIGACDLKIKTEKHKSICDDVFDYFRLEDNKWKE